MRTLLRVIAVVVSLPFFMAGQSWELGVSGGYGLYRDVNVTAGSASGSAGFSSGVAFGAVLGNQLNRLISGEARYTFRSGDMRVSSGPTTATASAQSHAMYYGMLVHATRRESRVRPFLAAGAGVKIYRGTGSEPSYQPLSNLVVLTHTSEAQPLISVGGGVKFSVSRRAILRLDFRDYATPVPTSILATPPNSKVTGWIHDFVFLVGVSKVF